MSDQLYEHVKQKVAELRQLKNYSVYEVDYNDTYDEYEDYLVSICLLMTAPLNESCCSSNVFLTEYYAIYV